MVMFYKCPVNINVIHCNFTKLQCGKITSVKHTKCKRCHKNRFGFTEEEVQPSEAIDALKIHLSIVRTLFQNVNSLAPFKTN
jgi:hypothetical protein